MKKFVLLTSLLLLASGSAFADWAQDFEELKSIPRSYEDSGAICEEVARLDMQKEFPAPQYKVEVGIAYGDGSRTIGELDIVIMDLRQNKVIKIAEVKCWKDVRGGLKKAMDQRARFLKYNNSSKPLFFRSTSSHQAFERELFDEVEEFFSIAQKGSASQGFDVELAYTLKEMHDHRTDMLRCQSQGLCAKP
ncbi:hypothetical protein EZJ49_09925 [Bdellovibrio bacteriovorus]|uniref:hypothetical protein n=1 Tax=Bdellovibrio bacteriovorus TaxID=959 RepID=UPI0021D08FDA|nr:hypothetical protein [Bdellovibrio bacteriovorus]UXR63392.1 hypothetical protein EZJ49_09925 [Bdellovibrio bacteriovorus]